MAIKDPITGGITSSGLQNPPSLVPEAPAAVGTKQARKMEGVYFGPTPPASPLTWDAWHPVTNPGWFAWVPTP